MDNCRERKHTRVLGAVESMVLLLLLIAPSAFRLRWD